MLGGAAKPWQVPAWFSAAVAVHIAAGRVV
jgi:hypothetical protein